MLGKQDDSGVFFFFPRIIILHILHFLVVKALALPWESHYCNKPAAPWPGGPAQHVLSSPPHGCGLWCLSRLNSAALSTLGTCRWQQVYLLWFTADCTRQLPSTVRSTELGFTFKRFLTLINLLQPCISLCYQRAPVVFRSKKHLIQKYIFVRKVR